MIISEKVLFEIERILEPLTFIQNAENVEFLLEELGWKFDDGILEEDNPIIELSNQVKGLSESIADFVDSEDTTDTTETNVLSNLIYSAGNIYGKISSISLNNIFADVILPSVFNIELPKRLLQYLLIRYLDTYMSKLAASLRLIGVIAEGEQDNNLDGKIITLKYEIFDVGKLSAFIASPKNVFSEVYSWGGDKFKNENFISNIYHIITAFNLLGGISYAKEGELVIPEEDEEEADDELSAGTDSIETNDGKELSSELQVPIFTFGDFPESYKELGVLLRAIPSVTLGSENESTTLPKGLELELYCTNLSEEDFSQSFPINENFQVNIKGDIPQLLPLQVAFTPDSDISIQTVLPDEGETEEEDANIVNSFLIEVAENEQSGPTILFGDGNSTHLQMSGFKILAALQGELTSPEVKLEAGCRLLEFIFDPKGTDNFISKVLQKEIKVESEFLAGISTVDGLYFSGSAGLDVTIPLHLKLLSILFESIRIALSINSNNNINFKTAMNFSGELGPVKFSVKELGITTGIDRLNDFNNLLDNIKPLSILPPTGAGLSIDAGAIVGGGFLEFDKDNERYAGMLQLALGDIGLVATGLIATRMPNGDKNFSMLVSIGVTFNPSIPLAFGFNLSGVGGLIGVNRTMDVEALRTGLRNHTADSILFPENPIANASKIISDLRTVLPPEDGRYVVGPMLKIGWGSPNIITADLGLFIELPEPVRVVILGQLFAALPKKENAIVVINVDVLGVIDFAKKSLAIDATIYDSKIVTYSLTGDAALRLMWGSNPQFAMSLGGFHPKFSPPPAFPTLRRLMLDLSSGSNLVLTCKVYKALTANSLQFGSSLDLYAKAGGVKVDGHLGFDTLFYFDPFSFTAAIAGMVTARYRGRKLTAIRLALDLSGPTPWNARGKASFEILWWDISFSFNETWGGTDRTLEASIDPSERLYDALKRNESWESVLPAKSSMAESLRSFDADAEYIVVHPSGNITVKQNVLPLNMKIEKFGNAPIVEKTTFDIDSITINNESILLDKADGHFARGQFQELTDDEKLSYPSFEEIKCGVSGRSENIKFGKDETRKTCSFEYESILIKDDRTPDFKVSRDGLLWKMAKRHVKGSAMKRTGLRNTGNKKFTILGETPKVDVIEEGYTIVNKLDMSVHQSVGSEKLSKMKADQILKDHVDKNPHEKGILQVVPLFELERAA